MFFFFNGGNKANTLDPWPILLLLLLKNKKTHNSSHSLGTYQNVWLPFCKSSAPFLSESVLEGNRDRESERFLNQLCLS